MTNEVARKQLEEYRRVFGKDTQLGCSKVAHRDLGFCAGCVSAPYELNAWRLLAIVERGYE